MAVSVKEKVRARRRRHRRVRRKISGTPDRPRLSVFRSLNHIYAQILDDLSGKTLVSAGSVEKEAKKKEKKEKPGKIEVARMVGAKLAVLAREAGIEKVVFDRGGYIYHGRIKALAESARAGGLMF